ncbi:hypothetical protein [Calothrix sp. 336/3]|uniref:hypothetical protein n=1 Tax=Calothrix sp. 336/3 TaxID=1337936 RepID=UPI0004E2C5B1|nr:hypothetical protein [Calothrix sp. 336/3]AKG23950.1 hypothetical protein IJ00_23935 [Calothrix sp. 336/3]
MITQHHDFTSVEDKLEKQIRIKQMQLRIAQESNMPLVMEALRLQLEELEKDNEFQAFMSILDD